MTERGSTEEPDAQDAPAGEGRLREAALARKVREKREAARLFKPDRPKRTESKRYVVNKNIYGDGQGDLLIPAGMVVTAYRVQRSPDVVAVWNPNENGEGIPRAVRLSKTQAQELRNLE